jgi:hypothetical protein
MEPPQGAEELAILLSYHFPKEKDLESKMMATTKIFLRRMWQTTTSFEVLSQNLKASLLDREKDSTEILMRWLLNGRRDLDADFSECNILLGFRTDK